MVPVANSSRASYSWDSSFQLEHQHPGQEFITGGAHQLRHGMDLKDVIYNCWEAAFLWTEGVSSLEMPAVCSAEYSHGGETFENERMKDEQEKEKKKKNPPSGREADPCQGVRVILNLNCCAACDRSSGTFYLDHKLLHKEGSCSGRSCYKSETTNSFQVQYFGFQTHKLNCQHSPWLWNGDKCHNTQKFSPQHYEVWIL